MNKSSGRGRRAGSPDTRARIQEVARRRFLADGYQGVTMRSVATEAGVDVALLSYYFSSKQGLFAAALALPVNPAEVVARTVEGGDVATLGERLLRSLLTVWDDPAVGLPLRTIAATATVEENIRRLVREAVGREIVERIAERLDGRDAVARAGAFTTQMAGVIYARYVLQLEPIASLSPQEVIDRLAPSLQLTLEER